MAQRLENVQDYTLDKGRLLIDTDTGKQWIAALLGPLNEI
mgnify:CR=1 FL=1